MRKPAKATKKFETIYDEMAAAVMINFLNPAVQTVSVGFGDGTSVEVNRQAPGSPVLFVKK